MKNYTSKTRGSFTYGFILGFFLFVLGLVVAHIDGRPLVKAGAGKGILALFGCACVAMVIYAVYIIATE